MPFLILKIIWRVFTSTSTLGHLCLGEVVGLCHCPCSSIRYLKHSYAGDWYEAFLINSGEYFINAVLYVYIMNILLYSQPGDL